MTLPTLINYVSYVNIILYIIYIILYIYKLIKIHTFLALIYGLMDSDCRRMYTSLPASALGSNTYTHWSVFKRTSKQVQREDQSSICKSGVSLFLSTQGLHCLHWTYLAPWTLRSGNPRKSSTGTQSHTPTWQTTVLDPPGPRTTSNSHLACACDSLTH